MFVVMSFDVRLVVHMEAVLNNRLLYTEEHLPICQDESYDQSQAHLLVAT